MQTDFLSIPSPVRESVPARTRSHGEDVSALNGVPSAPAAAIGAAHAEAIEPRSKSETNLGERLAAAQQPPPSNSVAMSPNDARAIEREVALLPLCLIWSHACLKACKHSRHCMWLTLYPMLSTAWLAPGCSRYEQRCPYHGNLV